MVLLYFINKVLKEMEEYAKLFIDNDYHNQ